MGSLSEMLENAKRRRMQDGIAFTKLDEDLCQLCHAHGPDKRSLFVGCFYDVKEVVPEFIELRETPIADRHQNEFYLRICKSCRASFLQFLHKWAQMRIARRGRNMDHDGNDYYYQDDDRNIPVRIDGAIKWLTEAEWHDMQNSVSE